MEKIFINEIDNSTIKHSTQEDLITGLSKKVPYNTPIYINSLKEFESIFGKNNKKLLRELRKKKLEKIFSKYEH